MTKKMEELREAIEDRHLGIVQMLLDEAFKHESLQDFYSDLECILKAKTFKAICELQDRNYREEIRLLEERINKHGLNDGCL